MSTNPFSRWTDDDLLPVLDYANGDFTLAVETILRHDATGHPPEELIQFLGLRVRGERQDSGRRSYSYSYTDTGIEENIQRQSIHNHTDLLGLGFRQSSERMLALNRSGSEGARSPSYVSSVPPSSSTLLFQGEGKEADTLSRSTAVELERQQIIGTRTLPENILYDMSVALPTSSLSSSTDAAVYDSATRRQQQEEDRTEDENQTRSERKQRQQNFEEAKVLQSAIEASLKETKNTVQDDADDDVDEMAVSYAIKVSKETFDDAYRKQELRDALEKRMINISLAASLSDPVKKSEEELIGEAMKRSLADPIQKSEDQLIEEARENSLQDVRRLETIMKSEEELVEAAKQKSLCTMSPDEELIEAVKRQSLESLSAIAGETSAHASVTSNSNQRQSTSITHPVGSAADDSSECSSCVEVGHQPPVTFDYTSLLEQSPDLDIDLMDRKMPARVLPIPASQDCCSGNEAIRSRSSVSNPNPNVASAAAAATATATDALSSTSSDQTKEEGG